MSADMDRLAQAVIEGRVTVGYDTEHDVHRVRVEPRDLNLDQNAEGWRALDPAEKLKVLGLMGFTATFHDHQPDCGYAMDAGLRCNCIAPGTVWNPPGDVAKHIGEDAEGLRAKSGRKIPAVERY